MPKSRAGARTLPAPPSVRNLNRAS
jgi:hypothetical protein